MRVLAAIIAALWLLNSTNQLGVKADENAVRRACSICFSKLWMVSCSYTMRRAGGAQTQGRMAHVNTDH